MVIPTRAFRTTAWLSLSKAQRATVLALAPFADRDGHNCHPSHARLAEATGLHPRVVARALHGLELVGVRTNVVPGRPSEYDLSRVKELRDPYTLHAGVCPSDPAQPLHATCGGQPLHATCTPTCHVPEPLHATCTRSVRISKGTPAQKPRGGSNGKSHHTRPRTKVQQWTAADPEYVLAQRLWESIADTGPTAQKPPDLQRWAGTFGKMHRLDKREYGWIRELMRAARADPFWAKNLRSADTLRLRINEGKLDRFIPEDWPNDDEVRVACGRQAEQPEAVTA